MIEKVLAGLDYDDKTTSALLKLKTPEDAKELLKQSDARYEEIEEEIEELEDEKRDLEALCHALEEVTPLWEAALETPEAREQMELMAAVLHPNQAKFEFLKDGAT